MTSVAPVPGDVLEDYEILEKIGGNMGLVFKARHRLLDKIVALKLLPVDFITDPARLARFQRELRVMGQLEHPNLVTAADARVVGCWHLVAMDLIDGMDLQHLVQIKGPLAVPDACEAARQAALGLEYAHQHGLIHRDIKPSNLMLTRAGTIKVIDMGLALNKEESTARLTQTGLVLGTMSYCPPEQFRDPAHVDIRADIYSLGCTLYHLLTGKPPYWQRTTFAEVVQAHLHEGFPSLAELRPDAPPTLEPVLVRMTAKDPGSRFATPDQVAEALTPFAHGADTKHLLPPADTTPEGPRRPTGRSDKWPVAPSRRPDKATAKAIMIPPAAAPPVVPRLRRSAASGAHRRGRRWKRIAAAFVLLVAIAGVAVFTFYPHDPVVILMDTTAERGVYDDENRAKGATNAEELKKQLRRFPLILHSEPISSEWDNEAGVLAMRPDLLIIHRSSFFHPLNAKMKLGYPPFTNEVQAIMWNVLYRIADDKLIAFLGYVGTAEPRTKFLVYSRGTDVNWTNDIFRTQIWPKGIEARFPALKGRIHTMLVPGGTNGTFKETRTAEDMRQHVKDILRLPDKRD